MRRFLASILHSLFVGCVTFALSGCALPLIGGAVDSFSSPMQLRGEQIIVALPLASPSAIAKISHQIATQYDLKAVTQGFPLPSIGLHCAVFELRQGSDAEALLASISRHPGVRLAQRNQSFETESKEGVVNSAVLHSDPYAELQYGPRSMGVDRAHRVTTGRGIRIAIIDTGIDRDHLDLRGRIVDSKNFVQGGERDFERDRHGTAIAGVIAASADNGIGIYGVAPAAEIVAVKACAHPHSDSGSGSCSSWTLALAIDFVINSGIRILNLSLAGPPDPLLTTLLDKALDESIVIVAAAGDSAAEPRFPASLEYVIGVAEQEPATRPVKEPREGKGRSEGTLRDLSPSSLETVSAPGQEVLTTAPGDAYEFQSGSSISAAHVSGLVALLLEIDPTLSPSRVGRLIALSSFSKETRRREGSVDACAALQELRASIECL